MFTATGISHLKTGKRELTLKLPLFSHRFVLHWRGAIETTVHRILSDGINMITDFQTFAFLMFMLKISRDHGRQLMVTCSAQKHLIIRSKYDENFKSHVHMLSGYPILRVVLLDKCQRNCPLDKTNE
jgi:hypothetical protein